MNSIKKHEGAEVEAKIPETAPDHDANDGWPQYKDGYEFDYSPEEVADES